MPEIEIAHNTMKQAKKTIRVGIDIRDLKVAQTGQKTFIEGVYNHFTNHHYPGLSFTFFTSSSLPYTGKNKGLILLGHIRYQFWKQVELPLRAWGKKCDIVFCSDYFVPYVHLGFKTVAVFHDAFFFENPEHYNSMWLKLYHNIAIPSARRCTRIMTVSHYARERLHAMAGFPMEQLVTIYASPKSFFPKKNGSHQPVLTKLPKKYILHVGVMEKRKNLPALLHAFYLLTQKGYHDIDLVLVGKGSGKINSDDSEQVMQTAKKYNLHDRIVFTGYVPDADIAEIYKNAFMYIFPSLNEGFGMPMVESFRFNLPVLASDNTCLPEVGGDAVLYFNPYDTEDMCRKMEMMIIDSGLRNELIEKGRQRLQHFSFEKTCAELAGLFRNIVS